MQETKVVYNNTTHTGKVEIVVNCKDEREYFISVENRKWLYPKFENMIFAAECLIRADHSIVNQLNNILNGAIDDMVKLVKISEEESEEL